MGNTPLMPFVSHAQNFEDIMLWRALKHVNNGFYIDIGACSPDLHSVTKAFYDRNWHGINVEPNPQYHRQLVSMRPRDINLCLAVTDATGEVGINLFRDTGLSTLDDTIARKHGEAGWRVDRQKVQASTLNEICRAHVPPGQEIHFLKIDVEGMEESVIRGHDWASFRPWIVVVEATLPLSRQESHAAWEHLLLSGDYRFAYADGLNRFYVAAEHENLAESLNYPPNVFDDFLLWGQLQAETRAREAEARARAAEARAQQIQHSLEQVYATRSWRMTAPLRWAFSLAMKWRDRGFAASCGEVLRKASLSLSTRAIALVDARPGFHAGCVELTRKLGLYKGLLPLYLRLTSQENTLEAELNRQSPLSFPQTPRQLTPRAREIYQDLQRAIANKRGKGL